MDKMKDLYDKVSKESKLQEKLTEIMKRIDMSNADETKNELLAFAKDAGFDVNYEDMQSFFMNMPDQINGELSESELDAVAGGKDGGGGEIKHSITSLGFYCAVLSIATAAKGKDCGDKFN